MPLSITALYAGILGVLLLVLSAGAGLFRGKAGISIGDGGNVQLLERMRRHGNAIEYVPIFLILMAILEANGANRTFLYIIGGLFVIARICHPIGLKADNMAHPLRAVGAGGSALLILVASAYAVWQGVGSIIM